MSLIPTVYRSTDPGAPVLSGTAGSFATLMDAVLVDGYGTGPDVKPGLGWVRAFSEGHKRAYQNSLADGGTGMFWRIDDSNAQYVLNSAFHTMSGIDTGVGEFGGGSNAWGKSITANTTSRAWVAVGNSRSVYVFIQNGNTNGGTSYAGFMVGDYECVNKSYAFNFGITHSNSASVTSGSNSTNLLDSRTSYGAFHGARNYDGSVVNSPIYNTQSLLGRASTFGIGSNFAYPFPPTGGVLAVRIVMTNGGLPIGFPPGGWVPEHNQAFTRFELKEDLAGMPGKWLVVQAYSNSACQGLIQLDLPWSY